MESDNDGGDGALETGWDMSEATVAGDNEPPAAFPSPQSAPEHSPTESGAASAADQWVLQAEAADVVGCSISAIRKWRREGSVSFRPTETSGGMERVEVRLADVQARAGQRVRPHQPAPAAAGTVVPPGMVMVSMLDLGDLYRQVSEADRRISEAERKLNQSLSENRLLRDELAQTRARVAPTQSDLDERRRPRPPLPGPSPSPVTPVPVPPAQRGRSGPGSQAPSTAPAARSLDHQTPPDRRRVPLPDPGIARPAPREEAPSHIPASNQARRGTGVAPPPRRLAAPGDRSLATLATELRRLYCSLQVHQRADSVDQEEHRRWTVELAAYDKALLVACRALGVRVPPGSGQRLQPAERVELTRGLAAAGLDVRSSKP